VKGKLVVAGLGLALVGAIAAESARYWRHPGQPLALGASASNHALPGTLTTRGGSAHGTYSLKYTAEVARGQDPMISLSLLGSLELWTVRVDADGTLIRARFAGQASAGVPDADATGATSALQQGFAEPVYIALDPKGQVTDLRFHPGLSRLPQTTWRSLAIGLLQFIAGDSGATLWQSNERDENGVLIAEYDAASAGGYDKRKLRYVSEYLPELKHRVIESSQHFDFDGAALPLHVSERESIGVTTGKLGLPEMAASTTLELKRSSLEPATLDPAWLAEVAGFERLDLQATGTARARQSSLDEAMASRMTFEEAMLGLYPGPDGKTPKAADAYHALMGQLRQSDSALPKLLDHIKKRGPLRNTLLAILRDSGTVDAQKALCDLLDDPASNATDRADIVRDLSLVKTPTADTLQKLTSLMHDPVLGAQAEFGVGANAYELRDSAPALAQQAVSTLVQDLQQAPDDVQRRRALGALGNSGADSALSVVQPYLGTGSEATQVSATEALRRMPGAQIDLLLADQLRHSPLAAVRIAAADAIRYRDPTPPLVSALSESLHLEPDVSVRHAVLDVAVFFLRQSSVLRDALAFVAANDPDAKLRGAAQQALN